jgi:hypothetical protein
MTRSNNSDSVPPPHEPDLRTRIGSGLGLLGGVLLVASVGSSCNLDPVHRAGVNNLGDEQSNLYPVESEFHRPGEPCTLCHSDAGPADTVFVLGGTIFWGPDRYDRRVDQAYVRMTGPDHTTRCFVTNCNGNFYVTSDQYQNLKFPLLISVERTNLPGGLGPNDEKSIKRRAMTSHIGREGSCAECHILGIRDYGSPGQIHLFDAEADVDAANLSIPMDCPNDMPHQTQCPEDR